MKFTKAAILILACGSLIACGKENTTNDSDLSVLSLPLSGTWTGTGSQTINGTTTACQSISFTLTFTTSGVTVSEVATCGGVLETSDPVTLTTASGQLSYNGTVLGTITDDELHLQYSTAQANYDLDLVLQDATHLGYTESDSGGSDTMTGSGTLTKQ